jgi:hypothetical protein
MEVGDDRPQQSEAIIERQPGAPAQRDDDDFFFRRQQSWHGRPGTHAKAFRAKSSPPFGDCLVMAAEATGQRCVAPVALLNRPATFLAQASGFLFAFRRGLVSGLRGRFFSLVTLADDRHGSIRAFILDQGRLPQVCG